MWWHIGMCMCIRPKDVILKKAGAATNFKSDSLLPGKLSWSRIRNMKDTDQVPTHGFFPKNVWQHAPLYLLNFQGSSATFSWKHVLHPSTHIDQMCVTCTDGWSIPETRHFLCVHNIRTRITRISGISNTLARNTKLIW